MAQPKTVTKRDPAATKERILRAGYAEFGANGYGGARTAEIAKRAKCNIRMIYHYFGGKEALYLACLEQVYSHIREEETALKLDDMEPLTAIERLVHFTFDHMRDNPDFVRLAGVENTQRGKFIAEISPVANAAAHLIETIDGVLERGAKNGSLRQKIDAFQLYVSILSLSYLHLSNCHTLSMTYGRDLSDANWLKARREHVTEMVLSFARHPK